MPWWIRTFTEWLLMMATVSGAAFAWSAGGWVFSKLVAVLHK